MQFSSYIMKPESIHKSKDLKGIIKNIKLFGQQILQ